jgi:hypothetical protein
MRIHNPGFSVAVPTGRVRAGAVNPRVPPAERNVCGGAPTGSAAGNAARRPVRERCATSRAASASRLAAIPVARPVENPVLVQVTEDWRTCMS